MATELKQRVDALYLEYIFPVLATLRIGEAPEALDLEARLLRAAGDAGIRVRRYILPADLPMSDAELLIREINADFLLSALLLIPPMPSQIDRAALEQIAAPEKRLTAPAAAGEEEVLALLCRVADAAERKAR